MKPLRLAFVLLPVLLLSQAALWKKPGPMPDGRTLLPNGWSLSPAGRQVAVGGFPLKVAAMPRSPYAIVNSNGFGNHFLAVFDTRSGEVAATVPIKQGWMGMAADPSGGRLYVSAGAEDRVLVFRFEEGRLSADGDIKLEPRTFPSGLAVSPDGKRLYAAGNLADVLIAIDLETRKPLFRAPVGRRPYTCALAEKARRVYVSNWGGDTVSAFDAATGAPTATVRVQDRPNDLALAPDESRLFVANGNRNTVSVIDTRRNRVAEQIETSLVKGAPLGSTPNALALARDGRTLYVANADNNAIAVVDVARPGGSAVKGFIPTGWYPAAVAVTGDGRLVIGNAKGAGSQPNTAGWSYAADAANPGYVGNIMRGTVSILDEPASAELEKYTAVVRRNSPLIHIERAAPAPFPLGRACPVKYVFYIIKENRTYDQVFGDMRKGNGDPAYCLFPEPVTPNHHALADEFVLFDNFYHNAEVSATGHHWTSSAYATEYVEKFWPPMYGHKGRAERPDVHDDALAYSAGGFFWDLCARAGLSYRSYGEFARVRGAPEGGVRAATTSLEGHVHPTFRGADFIAGMSDLTRYALWVKEFREFETKGEAPRFTVLSLPGDHTLGTRLDRQTPRAFVAENDLALGKMVDVISHSRFWKETAIFVVEDDAQSGPDHVDCHRTVALAISPYMRRGAVDSTMYSVAGMLRTMELILGLPPMSQYDASATPMWAAFQKTADPRPYAARPARIPLDEKNTRQAYGWRKSMAMELDEADEADDGELNEILWKNAKGEASPLPPRRVAVWASR